ncbi:MAG: GH92 family glycosyl hydrolase, partial [Bacteroidota bacterium]
YVNPFIGTGGHGHTYPGASAPFGMLQLSPDTRLTGWDGCSGYHYSDDYIYGFSHTHLSGTGVSDYGDVLLMPTNTAHLSNGADGQAGYRAHFSHGQEQATPGYYKVTLDSTDIVVELTAKQRSGMHRYRFPSPENQWIIIDLAHRDEVIDFALDIDSNRVITGHRHSKAWAQKQYIFFHLEFSHPIDIPNIEYNEDGKVAALPIINPDNDPVEIKTGISAVDNAGAKQNLATEIGEKTFDQIRMETRNDWNTQLNKIQVSTPDLGQRITFYTALYHTMLAPNIYQDVDGRYRGMDLEIHQTNDFDYYTVFSLWDTYRALHPLYTIIDEKRTNDFINTFLAKYDEGGIMPIWDLSSNYTNCMIGYHAVPVIADAYLKGIREYDTEKAFEAMQYSATRDHHGLESYREYGFIPIEEEPESISKTLEYAYDDWTIAQMADAMNRPEIRDEFLLRAQNYKNVFDPSTNLMRGRFNNTWFEPFDPYEVNFNYTEANAWQYSFYAPQDINGLMDLMGGKSFFGAQLDTLFSANAATSGINMKDITGLIGQYAHGNEPSHHMAYLYSFVNQPHKTQEKVHQILTELYKNAPDGISGNEDCGQMSAWYILSSLGFYPVTPASNQYVIGTPLFPEARIQLENGETFRIIANNYGPENKYIQSATLNGESHPYSYLNHDKIIAGGELIFEMGPEPSDWGSADEHIPVSAIQNQFIVPAPFIALGEIVFRDETTIQLDCADPEATIYYSLDGNNFNKYEGGISISEPVSLEIYAVLNKKTSATIQSDFHKIDPSLSLELGTEYAQQYNAGGDDALIDGIVGTANYRTGTWQGYHNRPVEATVDLGSVKPVSEIAVNFLIDQGAWIFSPTKVTCEGSVDGRNFSQIGQQQYAASEALDEVQIENLVINTPTPTEYRYIRLKANGLGNVPSWHPGYEYGGKAWIFIDEIMVR